MELLARKLPFFNTLLKGVGQIMLQENVLTGLLFFLGIFYGSNLMGLGAVLAVLAGTLTAKVFGYDKEETEQGLYGFSAVLVGVALMLFFKPIILSTFFSAPTEAFEMDLFSYNAVLCAIVFAGDKLKDGSWTSVAVILSVFITFLMDKFNLIQLTFPFVAATCIILAVKNLNIKQRLEHTITD